MIIVAGRVEFAPEDRRTFLENARAAIAACRGEPGCLEYSFSEDFVHPGVVRVFEAWDGEESLERHVRSVEAGGGPPHSVEIRSELLVRYDVAGWSELVRVEGAGAAEEKGHGAP